MSVWLCRSIRVILFREEELDLETKLPVGAVVGLLDVVERLQLEIQRQLAETLDFADASAGANVNGR